MPKRSLYVLIAACLLAASWPALSSTREVVAEMATLIENNYFDADKAREIARELLRAERAGAFDEYSDPRDLAVALTARLKPSDRHFNVIWFAAPTATASAAPGGEGRASTWTGGNHGFRAVSMLPGSVGYIEMRSLPYISFRRADDPARLAADAALRLIAGASAVILDLRYAVGGYPEMAGYIVSAFVGTNADVYNVFHGRDERQSERPVQPYHSPNLDVPLYVLVSGTTASAAESAAYTLQAAKRATIVGERTSGAANPGGMLPVRDGFNVFVSNSTPINPITGTNWEGEGVQPDIPMPVEHAVQRVHALALHQLLKQRGGSATTEIQWAWEYLTADHSRADLTLSDYRGTYADAIVTIVDDALHVRRHRHPVMRLRHLRDETFIVVDEPSQRVVFERNAAGAVSGFQLLRASGFSIWHPRELTR